MLKRARRIARTIARLLNPTLRVRSAYVYISVFSLLINTLTPLLVSYSYSPYVYAEETSQSSESATVEEKAPAEEETPVEEVTSSEEPAQSDETVPAVETPAPEETPAPSPNPTETPLPVESSTPSLEPTPLPVESPLPSETPTPTPTPIVTPEPTSTPTPTPTPPVEGEILDDGATSERVETPAEDLSGKECVDQIDNLNKSNDDDWDINKDEGIAETKENVKVGVRYEFPLENKVSVTFKCLPKDPSLRSTLKIQQVKVSDLNLPDGVNVDGDYAYDITTGMKDGDFEYDVTLPKSENLEAGVSYIEKSVEEIRTNDLKAEDVRTVADEKLSQGGETVKVSGIDHFTVYFVQSYADNTYITVDDSYYQGDTVYGKATRDTAANMRLRYRNPSDHVVQTCAPANSAAVYCDYTLPNNAPLGEWDIQIGRCDNNCNQNNNWTWSGYGEDHFNVLAVPPTAPSSSQTIAGSCIEDAAGQSLQCTANDVTIANVTGIVIQDDGCQFPGDTVTFKANWEILAGAQQRYDVGLYFATDGQTSARTGMCSVSTLPNSPSPSYFNFDGDACGDINSSATLNSEITMTVNCSDFDGNNQLDLPYCTSWDNNSNTTCNGPTDAVPGTGSKCNCKNDQQLPIVVPYLAKIEVIKDLNPSTDVGTFNLQVDGDTEKSCVADSGTTGLIPVGAGTSTNPGAVHNVGETACAGTDTANYVSSISCVKRGTSIVVASGDSIGPINVPVQKDDDIVCTITNTRKSGSINIVKNTVGGNGSFNFTSTELGNFSITTVANTGQSSFTGLNLGTYSVSETVPQDWSLTSSTCSDGSSPSAIDLQSEETVTCTFTNTQRGSVSGQKYNDLNGDGDKDTDEPGLSGWTIKLYNETGSGELANTTTDAQGNFNFSNVLPNNYQVCEIVTQTGWTNTDPGGGVTSIACKSLSVTAGQNSVVDFGNQGRGTVIIDKVTAPSNDPQVFDFTLGQVGGSSTVYYLSDADSPENVNVAAGTYSLTETNLSGWKYDGVDCRYASGASADNTNFTVAPGDVVTCSFTNTKQGKIIIEKQTSPNTNTTTEFAFTASYNPFFPLLKNMDTNDSGWLDPGSYTVEELDKAGWDLSNLACNDPDQGTTVDDATAIIDLDPGEEVTCIFDNTQRGSITVTKYHDRDADKEMDQTGEEVLSGWDIFLKDEAGAVVASGTTDVNGQVVFGNIIPDRDYYLSETQKPGYSLSSINCDDGLGDDSTNNRQTELDAGDDISCTVGNIQLGKVTIVKQTLPDESTQTFIFQAYGSSIPNGFANTILDDNTPSPTPQSWVLSDLLPGSYEFYELSRDGWNLSDITCVGDTEVQTSLGRLAAVVDLDGGEDVTCTFTNTQKGKIIVEKQILPDGNQQTFGFSGAVSGTIGDGETLSADVDPGSYTVSEDSPSTSGYRLTNVVCDDANSVGDVQAGISTFNIEPGETVKCIFTNEIFGSVIAHKYEDVNANGVQNAEESDLGGWNMSLYSGSDCQGQPLGQQDTDTLGVASFYAIIPGQPYSVGETLQTGWTNVSPLCQNISVTPGESKQIDFGNFEKGDMDVWKYEDTDGVLGRTNGVEDYIGDPTFTFRVYKNVADAWALKDEASTNFEGKATFTDVFDTVGSYFVCEVKKAGWEDMRSLHNPANNLSGAVDEYSVCDGITVGTSGYMRIAEFGNAQLSDIHGYKWSDLDGNRTQNGDEPRLSGWKIFIDEGDKNGQWDEGERFMNTSDEEGDDFGWYWFENLLPGTYTVCEVLQAGWLQTFPVDPQCHSITLPDSNPNGYQEMVNYLEEPEPAYNFGNRYVVPTLTIAKFNNVVGNKTIGDQVLFTITVTAHENEVLNVVMSDLFSKGFKYVSGSWTANSSDGRNLKALGITSEPAYASPGDWNLGNMKAGEVVTLTYLAEITSDIDPGTYKDLAWAQGTDLSDEGVLATAETQGYVATNFVGTEVPVVVDQSTPEAEAKVKTNVEEEEVLGATTELPATGSNTLVLLSILTLLGIGLGLVLNGLGVSIKLKKKLIIIVFGINFGLLVLSNAAHAVSPSPFLNVRLEEPRSPVTGSFNLAFVAMDIKGRNLTAKCFVDTKSEPFNTISVTPGGNTYNCRVDSSVLDGDGTYTFKVEVSVGEEFAVSNEESVVFDGGTPGKPKYIEKDKKGDCKYEVTFKTADDHGETSYVEIYRDDEKEYTVSDSKRIETITIGSNQKESFDDELYGSECANKPYYSVRAFNSAGTASSVRAEEITKTEKVTVDGGTVTTTGALPAAGGAQVGQAGTGEEGDEGAEVVLPDQGAGEETSEVLGEREESTPSGQDQSKNLAPAWFKPVLIGLGLLGVLFLIYASRKKES